MIIFWNIYYIIYYKENIIKNIFYGISYKKIMHNIYSIFWDDNFFCLIFRGSSVILIYLLYICLLFLLSIQGVLDSHKLM